MPRGLPAVGALDLRSLSVIGGHIARQEHPKGPGSDGASPYLPNGARARPRPRSLIVAGQGESKGSCHNPGSPGSDGASPYLSAQPHLL